MTYYERQIQYPLCTDFLAALSLSALALVHKPLDLFVPLAGTPAAADVRGFKAVQKDGGRHMHAAGAVILHRPFHFLRHDDVFV